MSGVGLEGKLKIWVPAVTCKIPDNLVSSKFSTAKVFMASYEKEKRPCMGHLLSNEYQRQWWQEKETWDKMFVRKFTTKKLLPRMIIKRKPPCVGPMEPKNLKTSRKPRKKVEPKKIAERQSVEKLEENKPEEIKEAEVIEKTDKTYQANDCSLNCVKENY